VGAGAEEVEVGLLNQGWVRLEEGSGPEWRGGDIGAEGLEMSAEAAVEEEMEQILEVGGVAGPAEGSGMW